MFALECLDFEKEKNEKKILQAGGAQRDLMTISPYFDQSKPRGVGWVTHKQYRKRKKWVFLKASSCDSYLIT